MSSTRKTPGRNSVKDNFMERTNADLFRVLSMALRKHSDPTIHTANILRVETSADLSTSRISVNGGADVLNANAGFFRNEIANNMKIRRVPNLRFMDDKGQQNADRIEELLRQARGE